MRILIVTRSFFPENSPRAFRATELCKEFARQGHEVVVFTLKKPKTHNDFERAFNVTINDLGSLRLKSPDFGNSRIGFFLTRAFYRLLSLSIEYPDIELVYKVKKALKGVKDYDLLVSIAVPYPIHWGVAWARTPKNRIAGVWVADCGDPYMGCETDSFKKLFYFKYIEKWFMRKADYISIPVESARKGYYNEFHDKVRIIPQGFNFNSIECLRKEVHNEVPTFAYAGGFIPGVRDPRAFLDYLTNVNLDFRFVIYTNTPAIPDLYKDKLNGKLEVREYIPRDILLNALSRMDYLVNFDNNTSTQVPSKLIDYALIGRPILNIKSPLEPALINQFLTGDYSGEYIVENIQRFNIENVARRFLELL